MPDAKNDIWPEGAVIIIAVSPTEYYVAGTGSVITFEPVETGKKAAFISIDEETLVNNK